MLDAFVRAEGDRSVGAIFLTAISLTGREFGAEEALRFGLVTEISSNPVQRAADIATGIGAHSATATKLGFSYPHQIRGRDWEHAGEVGPRVRSRLLATEDYRGGVRAAVEKRQPDWPSLSE